MICWIAFTTFLISSSIQYTQQPFIKIAVYFEFQNKVTGPTGTGRIHMLRSSGRLRPQQDAGVSRTKLRMHEDKCFSPRHHRAV